VMGTEAEFANWPTELRFQVYAKVAPPLSDDEKVAYTLERHNSPETRAHYQEAQAYSFRSQLKAISGVHATSKQLAYEARGYLAAFDADKVCLLAENVEHHAGIFESNPGPRFFTDCADFIHHLHAFHSSNPRSIFFISPKVSSNLHDCVLILPDQLPDFQSSKWDPRADESLKPHIKKADMEAAINGMNASLLQLQTLTNSQALSDIKLHIRSLQNDPILALKPLSGGWITSSIEKHRQAQLSAKAEAKMQADAQANDYVSKMQLIAARQPSDTRAQILSEVISMIGDLRPEYHQAQFEQMDKSVQLQNEHMKDVLNTKLFKACLRSAYEYSIRDDRAFSGQIFGQPDQAILDRIKLEPSLDSLFMSSYLYCTF
jgi:hypothetical protein